MIKINALLFVEKIMSKKGNFGLLVHYKISHINDEWKEVMFGESEINRMYKILHELKIEE